MKIIKNELKDIRERIIKRELLKLNKLNNTIVMEVDNLEVKLFPVVKGNVGYIYLMKNKAGKSWNESNGFYSDLIQEYKPNSETYKLILNAYCTYKIILVDSLDQCVEAPIKKEEVMEYVDFDDVEFRDYVEGGD